MENEKVLINIGEDIMIIQNRTYRNTPEDVSILSGDSENLREKK